MRFHALRWHLLLALTTTATVLTPAAAFGLGGCGNYAISLKLGAVQIGQGMSTTATASVTRPEGIPDPGERVFFRTSGAPANLSSDTVYLPNAGPGDYRVTVSAPAGSIGHVDVLAFFYPTPDLCSSSQGLTVFGAPASIAVNLDPARVIIGGTVAVTAIVTDTLHQPVPGSTIMLSTSGDDTFGGPGPLAMRSTTATDNKDGTYSAQLNVSQSPGRQLITATAPNGVRGSSTLTQRSTTPWRCTISANPSSIPADGVSRASVTATVFDSADNPLPNISVTFDASDPGIKFSANPVTSAGDGTAKTQLTASRTAGTSTLSAFAGNIGCTTNFAES